MISFRILNVRVLLVFAFLLGVLPQGNSVFLCRAYAQPGQAEPPGNSAKLLEDVQRQITRGRGQLDANQPVAVDTLRAVAQQSLNSVLAYIGPEILTAAPEKMPKNGIWASLINQAGQAHYWWGRAADQFGMRDEAITAFARATRFAGRLRPNATDTLARDSLLALGSTLRDGLPLVAPDDTLTTVAETAHGRLWQPRRFQFEVPRTAINANTQTPGEVREFLITSGRVYPPVPTSTVDANASLSRVPPIYRTVAADALPEVLRLDRMTVGYVRETSGPNKGLWRQAACVFYASSYLTRGNRNDQARAEALCAQFLKVQALVENGLGLSNPYNANGITNIWASEVSALWPKDDDDPRVRNVVGVQMPKINTPTIGKKIEYREIDVEPTSYPWLTGARQADAAPGDILLFQLTQARDEAEWLREMTHEYGHVSLPAFDGFKAPYEPYANGLIGETLSLMWAANAPSIWKLPTEFGITVDEAKFAQSLKAHVAREAMPALRAWKTRGPISPLRRDTGKPGLQYLQGIAVYAERVYGANVLGAAFSPLIAAKPKVLEIAVKPKVITAESLMASFPAALSDPFSKGELAPNDVIPIWLPGALDGVTISTDDFIARSSLKVKAGTKLSGWLYIPPRASNLYVEWKGAPNALQGDASLKMNAVKSLSGVGNAARFATKGRPGWQRLSFIASADLELIAAQFEK